MLDLFRNHIVGFYMAWLKCEETDAFSLQVAETCELAIARIKWLQNNAKEMESLSSNPYMSVDPAPPSQGAGIEDLKTTLLDETLPLFERYRALFSLRNIGSAESVIALAEGK